MEQGTDQGRDAVHDIIASARGESQLLRQLRDALANQRSGVANGDPEAIELASRAVANTVLTLDAARRRREDLLRVVSAGRPVRLDTLEQFTGQVVGLAEARAQLRAEAEGVINDLSLTQDVLQGAMHAGSAYLQALFSSVVSTTPSYGDRRGAPSAQTMPGGTLVNRSA